MFLELQSIFSTGSSPLPVLTLVVFLALIPVLIMATTCMLKLSVVFLILRSALGAGQIPSASIATLLSLVLTWNIMTPVANDIISRARNQKFSTSKMEFLQQASNSENVADVLSPLAEFMKRHTGKREIMFFQGLRTDDNDNSEFSISTIIPAFVISQLREALLIGCAIFIPFLVVDLVVANLLVGLGMVMVSPMQISLPLKLLLFTLCDGWILLSKSLILSYQ